MSLPFSRGLVVSCQALEGEPLHGSEYMAKMAKAAEMGGAVAIRANSKADVEAIRKTVRLPIIGIDKVHYVHSPIYITPTLAEVRMMVESGAEIISIDATHQPRVGLSTLAEMVRTVHDHGRLVMADVATVEEGVSAQNLGFDIISTTMSGYTANTVHKPKPDLDLIQELCDHVSVPVLAEGNVATPEALQACFRRGAYAVVVGTAITRPQEITQRFVRAFETWSQTQSMI